MRTILAILAGCLVISGCSDDSTGSDPECGNGIPDNGELCDGADLGGQTCESLGYTAGVLTCTAECALNTDGCGPPPTCGDELIQPPEECDGVNLNGQTCQTLNFDGGTLTCQDCSFDISQCYTLSVCGNDTLETGEQCDGADLGGQTCVGLGYESGTLACTGTCTYDTSNCVPFPTCGNGQKDPQELCEGTDLGGQTCVGLNYDGGTLACTQDCTFDTSGCHACGNGFIEGPEECDGSDLGGNDCTTIGMGFTGGTLACNATCDGWDTSQCTGIAMCGDWVRQPPEDCDGNDLGGNDCTTIGMGYTGGTLACDLSCQFDTSQCTGGGPVCGNGVREGAELCDGSDLGGNDCTTIGMGFTGGTLACSGTCDGWNTSGCTGGTTGWEIRSTEMRLMFSSFSLIAAHPTHPTTIAVCPAADDIFPFFEVYRSTDGFNFAQRVIYSFTPSVGFYSDPIALAYDPNDGNNLVAATWPMPPPSIDLAIIHAWSSNGGGFFDHSQWVFTNPWPADDMRFPGGAQSEVVWRANSFFHYSLSLGEWNDRVEALNVPAGCNMVMGFDMPWDNHDSVGVWCQNGAAFVCSALTGPCLAVPIPGGGAVDYLTFAPSNSSYMYILAQGPGGDAVFVSDDQGVTVTETLSLNGRVAKVHPADHLTACVFALQGSELHCTTDGGNTWQDLTPPDLDPPDSTNIHDFTFSSDGAIWATAYPGVIRHPPL